MTDSSATPTVSDVAGPDAENTRLLATFCSDILVRADADNRISYISPACRNYGWEPEELIGRSATELVHPDDLDRFLANSAQLFSRGPVSRTADREFRYRRKDGEWVWFEGNPEIISKPGGPPVILNIFRDVTHRRLLREAQAEQARFAAMAQAIAGVGYWRLDVYSRQLTWSKQMYLAYGLPPSAEVPLATAMAMVHLEDRAGSDARLQHALATGRGWDDELTRLVRPDGEMRYVEGRGVCERDETGAVRSIVGTMVDVTARKRAEIALAESEAQFRDLAEHTSDIIIRFGPDGAIRYISPACRSLGADPAEEIGQSIFKLLAPDAMEHAAQILTGLFDGGEIDPDVRRVHKLIAKDGRTLWLEGNPRQVRDDSGRVVEVVTVMRDVTTRQIAEIALEQSERRFKQMAENAPDMIIESGVDGVMTYVSSACEQITGFTPEELVGRTAASLMYPEDAAMVYHMCQTVFASKGAIAPWPVEFRATHKDGREIWLECKPILAVDPVTGRFTGLNDIIRDINGRKALEDQLRQAKAEAEAAAAVKAEFLANMSTRSARR